MTYTEALNYVLHRIEHDPDSAELLAVTLRRLGVICAARDDGPEQVEGFNDAFYGELSNVRWREQLAVAMQGKN